LKRRGHYILGSAGSDAAAEKLKAAGVEPVRADLSDAPSYGRAARNADAVIQASSTSDAHSPDYEPRAASAILAAIAGTGQAFIFTTGLWVYGPTGDTPATEETPLRPPSIVAWRPARAAPRPTAPRAPGR